MLAATQLLCGCAVGILSIRAPERLPADGLPPLTQRVSFDVCVPIRTTSAPTPDQVDYVRDRRRDLAKRIREVLSRGGVEADLVSTPGIPARLTITEGDWEFERAWGSLLSALTLSIIPGYSVGRQRVEVDVVLDGSGRADGQEHLEYLAWRRDFVWAPLIFHPDYVTPINGDGGWESARARTASARMFEAIVLRLADDLRARLGHRPSDPPWTGENGVVCADSRSAGTRDAPATPRGAIP